MHKQVKNSVAAEEIKKEYLRQHLDEVKRLVATWIQQLDPMPPLMPDRGGLGWSSVYRPPYEVDPDNNHIIRAHLKSRQLWRHHAIWAQNVEKVWSMAEHLKKQVFDEYFSESRNDRNELTEHYLGAALAVAFDSVYLEKPLKIEYRISDDELGIAWDNYKIASTGASIEERSQVEKKHSALTSYIVGLQQIKDLSELWREIKREQEQMRALANKALRSNDVLYPCRFCRHLWR